MAFASDSHGRSLSRPPGPSRNSSRRSSIAPSPHGKSSHVNPTLSKHEAEPVLLVRNSSESSEGLGADESSGVLAAAATAASTPSTALSPPRSSEHAASHHQEEAQWAPSEALDPELAVRFRQQLPIRSLNTLDEALDHRGISDYTFMPEGLLGKGKFSAVYVALKGKQRFAVKHTPLFPHHPLIASRLLREPQILAQLPAHPNLVKVYETIRTPGHFYLVEEYLEDYVTLDTFVNRCPDRRINTHQANVILNQLVDVVRNALHQPIFITHRDIKSENVLIHCDTLHIVILDFGLATHFSPKSAKLSTCCGSPAYHSPELWLSFRNPPGSIKYYGPEVDAWCVGITLLRCLTGRRCPIGIAHQSLSNIAEKVTDALLTVEDLDLRKTLAFFLQMDGERRMRAFKKYRLPCQAIQRPVPPPSKESSMSKSFKSTSFLPSSPRYSLHFALQDPASAHQASSPDSDDTESFRPRKSLRQRNDKYDLTLENTERHPNKVAISFIKYCLRCAGVLYHQWPTSNESSFFSTLNTPNLDVTSPLNPFDFAFSAPSSQAAIDAMAQPVYLHCILNVPEVSRPQPKPSLLQRFNSKTSRPSSTPPKQRDGGHGAPEPSAARVRAMEFWVKIQPGPLLEGSHQSTPSFIARDSHSVSESFTLHLSDHRGHNVIQQAVDLSKHDQAIRLQHAFLAAGSDMKVTEEVNDHKVEAQDEEQARGRRRTKGAAAAGGYQSVSGEQGSHSMMQRHATKVPDAAVAAASRRAKGAGSATSSLSTIGCKAGTSAESRRSTSVDAALGLGFH